MRIPRVLLHPLTLEPGAIVSLPGDARHHLGKVLRLQPGHPLHLLDGVGGEFEGELLADGEVRIGSATGRQAESPLSVCLIQGISRGQRMDYTLQKAVELGVSAIRPVFCERSVVKLDDKRLARRMDHWQGVIRSACEQSGRTCLPRLEAACGLAELPPVSDREGFYLDPQGDGKLIDGGFAARASLVVGPEGGLSDGELATLRDLGFRGVTLGPRILRTETAGVAALAVMQAIQGDFR